ncbi:hypothetical protein C1I98_11195 [Spongiactinospora gelatinilytica]|uniref:Uncharacterized protein n=1 Tax=Spongiactinospora gelatinilytica TaxID=2666298 RepID=A0A2W2GQ38_9ACTN|nr:hypothetical protein [Spongiactinospora gelatinilytica]PZG49873.1 hypothetical protein C1I98_11195 [Spongiactinospora gelatinilytica]
MKVDIDLSELKAAGDELRELIREAHGVTKDLRQAVKDARQTIEHDVAQTMKAEVKGQVDELGEATATAMRNAVAKVGREFDRLEALFTGTDPQSRRAGKPPLENLIRERLNATQPSSGESR